MAACAWGDGVWYSGPVLEVRGKSAYVTFADGAAWINLYPPQEAQRLVGHHPEEVVSATIVFSDMSWKTCLSLCLSVRLNADA